MKLSEIWYFNAFHQNEMLQKNFFLISAFFGQKTAKIDKKFAKIAKIQTI